MKLSLIDNSTASYNQVYQSAINLVSRREHSRFELQQKLHQRKFPSAHIEQVVLYCCESGYVNDQRFTQSYIRIKAGKGLGLKRIQMELQQKGIDSEQIRRALDELELDWYELAKNLYQRKYPSPQPDDFKSKQKRQRYLFYRGFDSEQVRYASSD